MTISLLMLQLPENYCYEPDLVFHLSDFDEYVLFARNNNNNNDNQGWKLEWDGARRCRRNTFESNHFLWWGHDVFRLSLREFLTLATYFPWTLVPRKLAFLGCMHSLLPWLFLCFPSLPLLFILVTKRENPSWSEWFSFCFSSKSAQFVSVLRCWCLNRRCFDSSHPSNLRDPSTRRSSNSKYVKSSFAFHSYA